MVGSAMNTTNTEFHRKKVVFIMGSTGTGKSRLSVDLAGHIPAEIINSDKMQVYKGLDILTNKIPESERNGVTHHLISDFDPNSDFTASDFCFHALKAIDKIVRSDRVPIIVGGSNSFIEALVEDPHFKFKAKYECCFLWLDVSVPILNSFVSKRVDHMVHAGLVDEVRALLVPGSDSDCTRGIHRAIGVPELDEYFKAEAKLTDKTTKEKLLREAIEKIKDNTRKLVLTQLKKIQRLRYEKGWAIHRVDATPVFQRGGKDAGRAWEEFVAKPSLAIVNDFLIKPNENYVM
ncbi:isopentenyltransferase 5 [Actinidia rufa]|uniref:adenylate dimethylallyltransferase (ADP/ATP-dependent) n=1 Tax=Actinidia rufa TaxID=165716 RepID=A0A7J0ET50_9ERIC|nr:isopentenyltransferase 5 [Actinidia rufa]